MLQDNLLQKRTPLIISFYILLGCVIFKTYGRTHTICIMQDHNHNKLVTNLQDHISHLSSNTSDHHNLLQK